jgi:hypothetical protein
VEGAGFGVGACVEFGEDVELEPDEMVGTGATRAGGETGGGEEGKKDSESGS